MAAQGNNLEVARGILSAACDAMSISPLVDSGDPICLGFVADMEECRADLEHERRYRDMGSKKMACIQGAHQKQRACYVQDFSDTYRNVEMRSMKAVFKSNCK